MSLKNRIIKALGGYTAEEYQKEKDRFPEKWHALTSLQVGDIFPTNIGDEYAEKLIRERLGEKLKIHIEKNPYGDFKTAYSARIVYIPSARLEAGEDE